MKGVLHKTNCGVSSMKKRIVILFASPRKKGFISQMVNEFINQIEIDRFELTILSCYQLEVLPCTDCRSCCKGVCPYNKKDQMGLILRELSQADFVILASPVYFANFPAPLKAIIDRTQQFFKDRSGNRTKMFPKKAQGFCFFAAGSSDPEVRNAVNLSAKMFFDSINVQSSGILWEENTDFKESPDCDFSQILPFFE